MMNGPTKLFSFCCCLTPPYSYPYFDSNPDPNPNSPATLFALLVYFLVAIVENNFHSRCTHPGVPQVPDLHFFG